MLGLVLVTHGNLAKEFLAICEHIMGQQPRMATVCIEAGDDMEKRREDIIKSVDEVDDGSGVIILTDMFGGTPSNLSISVMVPGKIEVVAGVNVPMLIKLISVRSAMALLPAVMTAQEAGRKYINVASSLLKKAG